MKKIYKDNKFLIISFILSFFLGLILGALKLNKFTFILFSLSANIFTITLIKIIINKFKIEFKKTEIISMILITTLIYLFYFISVLGRKFVYYWDFSCYYNLQTALETSFNTRITDGIRSFISSTWSGEYGNFLTFFPEFIFFFSKKTINAYVLSCVIIFIPYIVLSFSILLKRIIKLFKLKHEKILFTVGLLLLALFPLVHATFIYGQPDIFGLAFIFLIIALTIDYDFYKSDYERQAIIAILTYMLLISRRWYMYFILSYYLCYGLYVIIFNFKDKKKLKEILKHAAIYILIVGIFFGVTLFPLLRNIILNDYAYGYYLSGGLKAEFINQFKHLGYINFIFIMCGILYSMIKKEYRKYSIFLIIQYLIIIVLFTRIQNMGRHHSLLFVHIYIYYLYMFIIMIINKKVLLFFVMVSNFINFGYGIYDTNSKIFTDVPLTTPKQEDYYEIKKVTKWLKNNLGDENCYMIAHNNMYNPDKLRNIDLPDTTIMKHLPYGSAIIGVHSFPVELFDSKYIITTDPFEAVSIESKYNEVFNKLVNDGKFKEVKSFDMNNGYKILIYERVEKVSIEEVNMYIDILKEESKEYPKLYYDVLNQYLENNF